MKSDMPRFSQLTLIFLLTLALGRFALAEDAEPFLNNSIKELKDSSYPKALREIHSARLIISELYLEKLMKLVPDSVGEYTGEKFRPSPFYGQEIELYRDYRNSQTGEIITLNLAGAVSSMTIKTTACMPRPRHTNLDYHTIRGLNAYVSRGGATVTENGQTFSITFLEVCLKNGRFKLAGRESYDLSPNLTTGQNIKPRLEEFAEKFDLGPIEGFITQFEES